MNAKTLVIGYGNTLRGDDGAGPHAAERIATLYPSVDCIACIELGPDLAEAISRYNRIVFVDASVETKHLRWNMLQPRIKSASCRPQSHALSAQVLVELSIEVYNHRPRFIELVEIPACDFDFGEELSPITAVNVEKFVRLFGETLGWTKVRQLCDWSESKNVIGDQASAHPSLDYHFARRRRNHFHTPRLSKGLHEVVHSVFVLRFKN